MGLELQPWDDIDTILTDEVAQYRKINSGIHISLLATTRGGKTTLVTGGGNEERGILAHFDDVLILDTTGDPGPISDYGKPVSKMGGIHGKRRLTVTNMESATKAKVYKYIQKASSQGNVAIYADEVRQLTEKKYFGFGPVLDYLWLFSAKKGTSLIGGTQAPLFVPGAFYDQAKLHFLFKIRDEYRMKRLAEIGGDTQSLRQILPQLEKYEFAFIDSDGEISISKFQLESEVKATRGREAVIRREKRLSVYR